MPPRAPFFANRRDAGCQLAEKLIDFRGQNPVILGLPRGGVLVAAEIARRLAAPLSILLVNKIRTPGQPELAMGAVVDGNPSTFVWNEDVLSLFCASDDCKQQAMDDALADLADRRQRYHAWADLPDLSDRTVILVDDGVATGASMKVALAGLQAAHPKQIIVAVPVLAADQQHAFQILANDVVCVYVADLPSVSHGYQSFPENSHREVETALKELRSTLPV
jgi:putative phosphoribosyl transferase